MVGEVLGTGIANKLAAGSFGTTRKPFGLFKDGVRNGYVAGEVLGALSPDSKGPKSGERVWANVRLSPAGNTLTQC